jgi:magnesium chelatase family protein
VATRHSRSMAALIGGGSGVARPGAVSLAHRGVLFVDDAPEWNAGMLDALRPPLEEGEVRLARAEGSVRYPARFQLVLGANPCPCGSVRDRDCVCSAIARRRYLSRISGSLLDSVDLRAWLSPVTTSDRATHRADSTAVVRARVQTAQAASTQRWAAHGWRTNAEVPGPELRRQFALFGKAVRPL